MMGKKFLHYEITQHLGSGGMGDVYQARDLNLGRSVAIKFLPEAFLNDPESATRFQREARMLASLSHPNIAVLYGTEESDGRSFLVMELVPGETLAERLSRGPVPGAEAFDIALQIAEGLEAAHEKGIVHRDLKPANVKVLPNGTVKVLDFGLAKVQEHAPADAANAPTQMTTSSPGVVLGTPAYMSPEQAKGLQTDRATDIWAFGCVFYELLTGTPAFSGPTTTEVLAEILKGEPDWSKLPPETPERLQRLLRRCLHKNIRGRYRDIADVRIELEDSRVTASPATGPSGRTSRWSAWLAWGIAVVAVVVTAVLVLQPDPAPMRVEIVAPPEADQASLAISPDGREIAFTALTSDGTQLWLRSLSSDTARPIPGTEGASLPFWSAKEHSIAFFAQSKLKRLDVDTGTVRPLADASLTPGGGTWNDDGVILYSPDFRQGVFRVDQNGGTATRVADGVNPKFLPDGRRFLFRAAGEGVIFLGSLDGTPPRQLTEAAFALPVSSTRVLWKNQGGIFLQSFDADRGAMIGEPILVPANISGSADSVNSAVSVSKTGTLAYRIGSGDGRTRRFAWFDRSGNEISKVGETGGFSPDITPDGRFIALSRSSKPGPNIFLLDITRGSFSQLTYDPVGAQVSVLSPDGKYIAFSSARTDWTAPSIFTKPVGEGPEEQLVTLPGATVPTHWISNYLLFRRNDKQTGYDIWALPMRGAKAAGEPIPVVRTEHQERDAQFSPDGKWIAYESNRSGISEIYVHPFPGPGQERIVSKGGGAQVRWNPAGKELFYIALDGHLMVVPVRSAADGTPDIGVPAALFRTRMGPVLWGIHKQQYLVGENGQRFLISTADGDLSPINLILNWQPAER